MKSDDSVEEIDCGEHKFSGRLVPVLLKYETRNVPAHRVKPSAPDGKSAGMIKAQVYPTLKAKAKLRAILQRLDA